jgi:hypothetical protein
MNRWIAHAGTSFGEKTSVAANRYSGNVDLALDLRRDVAVAIALTVRQVAVAPREL